MKTCTRLHSESKIDLQVPILVLIHEKTVAAKLKYRTPSREHQLAKLKYRTPSREHPLAKLSTEH